MGFVILTVVFCVFVVTVFCEAHTLDVGGEGAFQLLQVTPSIAITVLFSCNSG